MQTFSTITLHLLAPLNVFLLLLFFAKPWLPPWASRVVGDKFINGYAVLTVFSIVVLVAWAVTASSGLKLQSGRAIGSAIVVGLSCLVALSYLVFVLSDGI
ncbi:MAG: hypothetical protein Q8R98_24290 [Rubrivivax sp.]|nr:hypothetical protein [Rubrivivax sp.]MDP3614974.1 hypothetical protein [Rubrivivax sp.]